MPQDVKESLDGTNGSRFDEGTFFSKIQYEQGHSLEFKEFDFRISYIATDVHFYEASHFKAVSVCFTSISFYEYQNCFHVSFPFLFKFRI